jgi:hypothetical protein
MNDNDYFDTIFVLASSLFILIFHTQYIFYHDRMSSGFDVYNSFIMAGKFAAFFIESGASTPPPPQENWKGATESGAATSKMLVLDGILRWLPGCLLAFSICINLDASRA